MKLRETLLAILVSIAVAWPLGARSADWKAEVDRLWNDEEATSSLACQMFPVRSMPPLLRGSTSGRTCVVRAVDAAREGDRKLARGWLRAGYCDNSLIRDEIDSAGDAAVDYAVEKYGSRAP
jgi:hypothetical protein